MPSLRPGSASWVLATCAVAAVASPRALAETVDAPSTLEQMTLEELMDVPVSVATPGRPQTARETPGVVTVITREEIEVTGARDLVDLLSLVPGFAFGVDVQGNLGAGFRGIWGNEGKVLLLVDGFEMNELDYSTIQFANRFPMDQIERIEVIRGPGSVVYGGFAELAVINVITRSPEDLHGVRGGFTYGRMEGATRASGSFLVATPVDGVDGLDVSVGTYFGVGSASDGNYRDNAGSSYAMGGVSSVDPRFLNAAIGYKGLKVRFLMDQYHMSIRDGFGKVLPGAADQTFPAYFVDARYAWQLADGITLTPRFGFKHQVPWRVTDKSSDLFCDRYNQRYTGGLTLSWDPLDSVNVLAAVEGYAERDGLNDNTLVGLQRLYSNGGTSVVYGDFAAYSQVAWLNDYVNLTAGARYEYHTQVGHAAVPRVALTKTVDWFHAKVLFAMAFRSPGVQNLAVNPGLSSERTTVFEIEMGAKLGDYVMLTASGFYMMVKDPIVFGSKVVGGETVETYQNFTHTGTLGGEAVLQVRHPRVWMNLGYSFYSPRWLNDVNVYAVPGRDDTLLGFAAHTLTLAGGVRVTEHFQISPTAIFTSDRYGLGAPDSQGRSTVRRFRPALQLNLFLSYRDLGVKGLDLGFGVYNLLSEDIPWVQPYDGGHAALPAGSREFLGRVSYTWTFP